jgi:hypothetical protein
MTCTSLLLFSGSRFALRIGADVRLGVYRVTDAALVRDNVFDRVFVSARVHYGLLEILIG